MKSFTAGQTMFGIDTKNTSASNLSWGAGKANDRYRSICGMKDWPWLTQQRPITTVNSQQMYQFPYDCDQVRSVAVVVSTITYSPRHVPDQVMWDRLNLSVVKSDIPQWWFTVNGQLGLWPTPSAGGALMTVTQKCRVIDLTTADYSTGTITSVANGGTAVVGSGTTWTKNMVGSWIQMASATGGDQEWYQIGAVPSPTSITLVRSYGGVAIAAGSAQYVIGQMPLLPESYHNMPWVGAAYDYWSKELDARSAGFMATYQQGLVDIGRTWAAPDANFVIDDGGLDEIVNPNLTISL